MKTNILPILIILCIGAFAGNSLIIQEEIKTPHLTAPITLNPKLTTNQLIVDLNSDKLEVTSTAMDQPKIDVNIERPVRYVEKLVPVHTTDTLETIVFRSIMFPISSPRMSSTKPVIPNSVKRI